MTTSQKETNIHVSVMPQECLEFITPAFKNDVNPIFVDGTLGGAGHTKLFLDSVPELKVLSFDLDINAIEKAKTSLKKYFLEKRVWFAHQNFIETIHMGSEPKNSFSPPWNAILLDLGYSSNQLEDPQYGMSFMAKTDSEIDMRLSRPPHGASAWNILNESTANELAEIFEAYGEIKGSKKLAQKIKEGIQNNTITNSVNSLAKFVEKNTYLKEKIHPATLVFQSLRITVNDELRNIDIFLKGIASKVKKNGRIAIISFHSLEDRIVKRWGQTNTDTFKQITSKPITATDEEIRFNPRSRSAKLRIYERI